MSTVERLVHRFLFLVFLLGTAFRAPAQWTNVTANLADMPSECGNLCLLSAVPGQDKIIAGVDRQKNVELVRDLCEVMTDGSLCALGGLTPLPVLSALDHFGEDFARDPARAAAE